MPFENKNIIPLDTKFHEFPSFSDNQRNRREIKRQYYPESFHCEANQIGERQSCTNPIEWMA